MDITKRSKNLTDNADSTTSHSSRSHYKKRLGLFAIGCVALLAIALSEMQTHTDHDQSLLVTTHQVSRVIAQDSDPSDDDEQATESDEEQEESRERAIEKLLPDLKILNGSPAAKLDLKAAFDIFQGEDGAELSSIEVIFNKKSKVVETEIQEDQYLVLTPGKVGSSEIIIEFVGDDESRIHSKFAVSVWEPDYWQLAFTVLGGLGIFLLGMKSVSDGLQAVAGGGLRKMIALATNKRLMATGVGVLVTMTLQSSSITTVMVVGFVNSGFMTLAQAIGVIFGANIGTTVTGWILVLKIGKYGLPIAGAAALSYLFVKRDRIRYFALAIMGLGLVFLGLELMKDGFSIVKDLPEFEAWFERFSADSYLGVLKCAAVGCVLTFIVQSSSATLGITIGLAQIGVIPFETAAALVLGENVGTTITAWLASLGANVNAKRAAYAHVVFNLIGVAWITAIFPWYLMLIRYVVSGDTNADVSDQVTTAIASTHTGFNVVNTLLFLPLGGVLASVLTKLIPERQSRRKQDAHLTNLDVRMLESPVLALEQSNGEILKMAKRCQIMAQDLRDIISGKGDHESLREKSEKDEQEIDLMQDDIVTFMTRLLSSNIPEVQIDAARRQLRMADELESISDYLGRIAKYQCKLIDSEIEYEAIDRDALLQLHDLVSRFIDSINESLISPDKSGVPKTDPRGREITQFVRQQRKAMIDRMANTSVSPRASITLNRQLNAYRRVRDHGVNILESVQGEK